MNTQQSSTTIPASNAAQAYSIETFCERFGLGRSKTYEEIRLGRLQVRKIGSRTLIAHEDAIAWFNALPRR
jgi:hypothetical protein